MQIVFEANPLLQSSVALVRYPPDLEKPAVDIDSIEEEIDKPMQRCIALSWFGYDGTGQPSLTLSVA